MDSGQRESLLIADGPYDSVFDVRTLTVNRSSTVPVHMLRRGGFTVRLRKAAASEYYLMCIDRLSDPYCFFGDHARCRLREPLN